MSDGAVYTWSSCFDTSKVGTIDWHYLCVNSNGNKLEIVANEMKLNTNLDLSRDY